tara:strand:- start:600 stop:998 length:399 start_codon:yes stop_codon:yes gene_type:complete
MEAISKEIIKEKSKTYPDTNYIQRLQRLMDKVMYNKRFELEDFISTARSIDRKDFEKEYFMIRLQKECTTIILFAFGQYIQVLDEAPSEAYYYDTVFDGVTVEILSKDFNDVARQAYNLHVDDNVNIWKKGY